MKHEIRFFQAMRPVTGFVAIVLMGMLSAPRAHAQLTDDTLRIQQGFLIAPVPLNLAGLDSNLVGLGSYLVNAVADCNGCHNGGAPPNMTFSPGQNPFFGQGRKVNPAVYLSGGRDFGQITPPNIPSPHIIARNLTPDKTGLPEGGHSLSDFMAIMRSGVDFDHLHPTCTSVSPTPTPANCLPAPIRGDLLQIMPWPSFQNMSDRDLTAIYTYLSAIPCIAGPTDPTDPLHNDCTPTAPPGPTGVTIVITGPGGSTSSTNTFQTVSSEVTVDASLSTSSNAGALTYSWAPSAGFPNAGILRNNTATPTFQLIFHSTYQFTLTVTDAKGLTATATVTVQFI
jgi:hypothetical protein